MLLAIIALEYPVFSLEERLDFRRCSAIHLNPRLVYSWSSRARPAKPASTSHSVTATRAPSAGANAATTSAADQVRAVTRRVGVGTQRAGGLSARGGSAVRARYAAGQIRFRGADARLPSSGVRRGVRERRMGPNAGQGRRQ